MYRKCLDLKEEKIKQIQGKLCFTPASETATETIDSDNMLSDYDDYYVICLSMVTFNSPVPVIVHFDDPYPVVDY